MQDGKKTGTYKLQLSELFGKTKNLKSIDPENSDLW